MNGKLDKGEFFIGILDVGGLNTPKRIPNLDNFIMGKDLIAVRDGLPHDAYYS